MASRANIGDFIGQINAKPNYEASINADGSVQVEKNGVVRFVSVFWNISNWQGGAPGASSTTGPTATVTGKCEITYTDRPNYPVDKVTIQPDGQSGSGAYTMSAQDFLDGLN